MVTQQCDAEDKEAITKTFVIQALDNMIHLAIQLPTIKSEGGEKWREVIKSITKH